MTITVRQLIACWGPPLGPSPDPDMALGRICTDSRSLQPGDFFVPLVGESFDGHRFLAQLPALGAQASVVGQSWSNPVPSDLLHWRVDDTLQAYQQLALLHRRALGQPVVAVTGSAGKTTTRELIRAALAPLGPVHCSEGNNNNDIGVPLTVLSADTHHRALVIEMGMRGPGEIERLSRCTEPDVVVITNIGTAHIGRLGSREAIAAAKCEITAALKADGVVVIPAGDALLETALSKVWSGRVLRVRLADDAPVAADCIGAVDAGQLEVGGHRLPLPLEGRHNARNCLLALAVADQLGVSSTSLNAMEVSVPGGRNRRLVQGGLRFSMRPTTHPLKRSWPPSLCCRPSPVAVLRYLARCSSWEQKACSFTALWRRKLQPSSLMVWWWWMAVRRVGRWRTPQLLCPASLWCLHRRTLQNR